MKLKLNKYEKDILKSYDNGEWKSVKNLKKRKEEIAVWAANTIKKNKRLNIRISERDLNELKREAQSEGIPYQTYVSSILHKFITGKYSVR